MIKRFNIRQLSRAMAFAAKKGIDYFYKDYCADCLLRNMGCPHENDCNDFIKDEDIFAWWIKQKMGGKSDKI